MNSILRGTGAKLTGLLLPSLAACAPGRLPSGTYVQARQQGAIGLEGKTLQLADDHIFIYTSWTDNLSGNRYGTGTYQVAGRQLHLRFAAPLPIAASAQMQALAAKADTLVLAFVVRGRLAVGPVVTIPFAVVTAYDKAGKLVAEATTDVQGRAQLRLPLGAQPQQLRAQSLGFVSWNQRCGAESTAYQVELPADRGTPYVAGTVKEFRVRRMVGRRLLLSEGKAQVALERQSTSQ